MVVVFVVRILLFLSEGNFFFLGGGVGGVGGIIKVASLDSGFL